MNAAAVIFCHFQRARTVARLTSAQWALLLCLATTAAWFKRNDIRAEMPWLRDRSGTLFNHSLNGLLERSLITRRAALRGKAYEFRITAAGLRALHLPVILSY